MTKGNQYRVSLGAVSFSDPATVYRDIVEVVKSGQLTEADWTARVEWQWARYIGVKHAIAVPNGTLGLMLAYMVAPGPIVAAPALTFPATINPAILLGKKIRLTDTDGLFMANLHDEAQVQVPVHLMGIPHPKMEALAIEAKRRDMFLIEDVCEGAGAEIGGKKCGSFGNAGIFSFYVSHNISAGEYGVVTTNDDYLAHMMRSLKNHGRNMDAPAGYFSHHKIGLNFKVTEVNSVLAYHAAIQADEVKRARLANARRYQREITSSHVTAFRIPEGASLLGMPLEVREDEGHTRDGLMEHLFAAGIECRAMFPALNKQLAYGRSGESYPNAERMAARCLYVPVGQGLTDEDIDYVVARINTF